MNNDKVKFTYTVHAVIFGADESLLKICLTNGFSFTRLSLNPRKNNLDRIFDTTDFGLRREYETARIDDHTLDVICAVKEESFEQSLVSLDSMFNSIVDLDLASLDNQIRAIRLMKEGPVRFKKMAAHLDFVKDDGEASIPCNYNAVIPIGEAMTTRPISKFHCDEEELTFLNSTISGLTFPLSDALFNACHRYYDLSYHTEPCVSVTLLTTALEILFLERNANSKRQKLAKRCAVFLYNNAEQDRMTTYKCLISLYDKRSDFVHEGMAENITKEDIISLRAYVRDSLLKATSLPESKDQRIDRLIQAVTQHSW